MLSQKVFRAYDIRGVADVDFSSENVRYPGKHLAQCSYQEAGAVLP